MFKDGVELDKENLSLAEMYLIYMVINFDLMSSHTKKKIIHLMDSEPNQKEKELLAGFLKCMSLSSIELRSHVSQAEINGNVDIKKKDITQIIKHIIDIMPERFEETCPDYIKQYMKENFLTKTVIN